MRYLVTGGTGFIGSALVQRLVKDGNYVRVLDNDLRGSSKRLSGVFNRIDLVKTDIRDYKAVQNACRGIDCVCHLAYLNGTEFFYKKPELVLEIGVKGIINVIDACINEGIKELILASSSEVYQTPAIVPTDEAVAFSIPDPLNPRYSYAGGKIISELMAINYGRKHFKRVVIFRPHNVYGPDMGWEHVMPQLIMRMKQLAGNSKSKSIKLPVQGTGKQTRAFVFIDDFIDGLMLLLKKGEHLGIYNIGTTEEKTVIQVAEEIGKYFGKKAVIISGKLPVGGTLRRCPDISKLKKLGYFPKTSFKEGLRITAAWYDNNSKGK